ncbi:Lipoprotein Rz1 precursor [Frateuria aurantia DSM 6220]|uniref:Lipoprotein Rz1 n=1 Tax=Frateuria aurantia (strain ATCC 33424 / DSM 6220 / KCTC 2777 / LMG 1558 / NBRC 3245 / NCIMB 13370) TaxID=767434 RepID=H8L2I6_FRAAD|nr:Lipoprotein Rz1 precursor [Frateuria aurantia DSM 6220]
MPNKRPLRSLLICVLLVSGCAQSGVVRPQLQCPQPAPVPASLMQLPTYRQQLQQQLFESAPMPTHK